MNKARRLATAKALVESVEETLERRVARWLGTQGFPLEYRVARAFQKAGFEVRQSHYVDIPGHLRPREIDVLAIHDTRAICPEPRYELYIECKWSKSRPWVVFSSDAEAPPSNAAVLRTVRTNPTGESVLWLLEHEDRDEPWLPPFGSPGPICHGGRLVLGGDDGARRDRFYMTMQSVATITAASTRRTTSSAARPEVAVFAFPIVVVDAPMFCASLLAGTDKLAVTPVRRARIMWRGLQAESAACIEVVHADTVDAFAVEVMDGIRNTHQVRVVNDAIRQALNQDSCTHISHLLESKVLSPPIAVPTVIRALATRYESEQRRRFVGE